MADLSAEEAKYFESGGEAEVPEVAEEAPVESAPVEEAPPEKKRPSKFNYSEDTDNVVDDLGRKYVPLNAVQEERKANKALKQAMEEMQGRFSKFEEGEKKLATLMARLQGEEQKAPEFDKDPLGYFKYENETLRKKLEEVEKGVGETKAMTAQERALTQFRQHVNSAEASFAAKQQDYPAAAEHLRNIWTAELMEAGVPEEHLEQALFQKGAQFSAAAIKRGANPAEAVYNLAKRVGYQAKASEQPESKLKQIADGQDAAKSLASAKAKGGLSLESLASMSDDDMEALIADPKKWAALGK